MRAFCDSALAISTICCWATPSRCTGVRGIDVEADAVEHALGLGVNPLAVDGARECGRANSRPRKMFCAMLEIGNQREFLEDDRDAEVARVRRRVDLDALAVVIELAADRRGRRRTELSSMSICRRRSRRRSMCTSPAPDRRKTRRRARGRRETIWRSRATRTKGTTVTRHLFAQDQIRRDSLADIHISPAKLKDTRRKRHPA